MRDFKKALLRSIAFLIVISVLSVVIITPYHLTDMTAYSDRLYRESLRGTIDYFVVGSSHSLTCLYLPIIDSELNCNSYNLSGTEMTFRARTRMLEEEIDKNPIKTVVFEISYNALQRSTYSGESNYKTVHRLATEKDRLEFLIKNETLSNYDIIYAEGLYTGVYTWERIAKLLYKNFGSDNIVDIIKNGCTNYCWNKTGYIRKTCNNLTITEDVSGLYNSTAYSEDYNKDNFEQIEKMVELCREANANVIFVVTPIADCLIWKTNNLDAFYSCMTELAEKYNSSLYDFNLLKCRYDILNDEESFSDECHMCETSAKAFTQVYCDVMNKVNAGEDVSDMFYSSYSEMKADSPYWAYVQ